MRQLAAGRDLIRIAGAEPGRIATLAQEISATAFAIARAALPDGLYLRIRTARREARRRTTRLTVPTIIPASGLRAELAALGLGAGRDLMLHSAFRALGQVDGGPTAFLALLAEVAGPRANLLAPTYPLLGTMLEWMATPDAFDMAATPSCMGALSETLRRLPEARRSAHPTHSVAVIGPDARAYTEHHHEGPTPCGPLSPLALHAAGDGLIVVIGSGVGHVTSYHVVEDEDWRFPLDVYMPRLATKLVIWPDGRRGRIPVRVHAPYLQPWRIDNFAPKERQFHRLMREAGIMREGRLGATTCQVIEAKGLLAALRAWAPRGLTIYHSPALIPPRVTGWSGAA